MRATLIRPFQVASVLLLLAGAVAPTAPAQTEAFIPGYTDFPNHLRVHSIFDRARMHGEVGHVVAVRPTASGGIDWADAGVGAGGAIVLLGAAAGLAAVTLRRPVRRTAPTA